MANAPFLKFSSLLKLPITFVGISFLILFSARIFRPDYNPVSSEVSAELIKKLDEDRRYKLDLSNPPVVNQTVDYSEGEKAPWFPKGESPLLSELVDEGSIPPVEERVGPEPVVMKGVEGIGNYGGTWHRIATSNEDIGIVISNRLSNARLVRWSPLGYPIVPQVAKSWEIRDNFREFIFHLRKGMCWSDGRPFTADDILYWWNFEENDPERRWQYKAEKLMVFRGKLGEVEKIDDHTVLFRFSDPRPLFLESLASYAKGATFAPAHYLRKYHPRIGDPAFLAKELKLRKLPSAEALYFAIRNWDNPEHPRLWPWVYRTYKADPPQEFVRNPYYYAVDAEGNQLPYVDRVLFNLKPQQMVPIAASNGDVTLQARHIKFQHYTLLMSQRKANHYEIYHWNGGYGSSFIIAPNLNRKIEADKPQTRLKWELLNRKEFRQALSLAIDRQGIISTEYSGLSEAVQVAPGPQSRFYEPSLYRAFTEHNPTKADALLDGIGLTRRDSEGFRTFRNGARMLFFLDIPPGKNVGIAQIVVDDWARVGVRVMVRERSWRLNTLRRETMLSDFRVASSAGQVFPLLDPRLYVPVRPAEYAMAYSNWFLRGGYYGVEVKSQPGVAEPPQGHPLRKALDFYDKAIMTPDPDLQVETFRKVLKIAAENLWVINVSSYPPLPVVVKKGFRNVPKKLLTGSRFLTPGNGGMETFYFDHPHDSPGALAKIKREMIEVRPNTRYGDMDQANVKTSGGLKIGRIIKISVLGIALMSIVLISMRHPFIGRRIILMAPTLLIISIFTFIIIQLPPGDFLTSYMAQLEANGEEADLQRLEEVKELFHLNESIFSRYLDWIGLRWFFTFQKRDEGFLQGNLGRSMESLQSVNDLVGDRIILTVLISLGTILLTWAIAIPVGIYSAVRQYSASDYILTLVGFIGMSVPNFLLALILMYLSSRFLGLNVSGLFSPEYSAQPEWTWGKFVDLGKHIWVPVVVIGTGGTAAMIRVLRGNLLDELNKPYVITARAKGVRPIKLLIKYPVRLAINPFISGLGTLFPQLVSGGALVAIVLSLPTVGPLLLSAIMSEDMYLAGSMVLILSFLGVCGVLVSDLLLIMLDPRIRYEGGAR